MSYSCLRIIFLFLLFATVIPPFSVIDSFLFFMFFLHPIGVHIFKVCLSSYKKLNIFITQNSSSSLLLSYQHRASQTIPYPVNLFPVVSSRKVSVFAPKKGLKTIRQCGDPSVVKISVLSVQALSMKTAPAIFWACRQILNNIINNYMLIFVYL